MPVSVKTKQARRNGFNSAAAQTVANDLSEQFSRLLGDYVDPTSFCFGAAGAVGAAVAVGAVGAAGAAL